MNSSVTYDRDVKLKMYAKAGILEYWIVNLEEGQVEVYQEPFKNGYSIQLNIAADGVLFLTVFNIKVKANKILK